MPGQGRYKSFLVESDQHFLTLVRYVERNAKRAALVKRAEDWPWSSAHVRVHGNEQQKKLLSPWPMPEPRHYVPWLNESQGKEEIENIGMLCREAGRMDRRNGCQRPWQNSGWNPPSETPGGPRRVPDTLFLHPFPLVWKDNVYGTFIIYPLQ